MEWNKIDEKLIEAYVTLKMADALGKRVIPEKYRNKVEIEAAERTIEVLEGSE